MKTVYDEYSLCRSSVVEFYKRLLEGRELVEDYALTWQAHRVITPETIVEKSKGENSSSGKVMMSLFYHKSPLPVEYMERGATVNAQRYQDTLQNRRRAINSKRPCILSYGVILLHHKSPRHAANAVKTTLQQCNWETLEPLPYTPDISPCVFHVSGLLKRGNQGH
ncbi:mariner Mos1 transposase [Trichonephila clavipes]|nr:mariner Mos1 transposase [Trichonephila clavipes]